MAIVFFLNYKKIFFFLKNKKNNQKINNLQKQFNSPILINKKSQIIKWPETNEEEPIDNLSQIFNYNQQVQGLLTNNPIMEKLILLLFNSPNIKNFTKESLLLFLKTIANCQISLYIKNNKLNHFEKKYEVNNNSAYYQDFLSPKIIFTNYGENKNYLKKGIPYLKQMSTYHEIYFPLFQDKLSAILAIQFYQKSDFFYKAEILYKFLLIFEKIYFFLNQNLLISKKSIEYYLSIHEFIKNNLAFYLNSKNYAVVEIRISYSNPNFKKNLHHEVMGILKKIFPIPSPWLFNNKKENHYLILFEEKINLPKIKDSFENFFFQIYFYSKNDLAFEFKTYPYKFMNKKKINYL